MVLPLTILHLSDLQFGPKHRFAMSGDAAPTRLLDSIRSDVQLLRDRESLPSPDLLFVTGDLTERARPSEFDACEQFIRGLADAVRLPITRVVVIPGNHDISRDECEGFFKTCSAREETPKPPFWPKWHQYNRFLRALYGDADAGDRFNEDEPWTLLDFPDLRVVVAGLNSTIAESHREDDHYGLLGPQQLKWFLQRLEPYAAQRWLRLAMVHHNVRRGPTRDDENLRDGDLLRRKLGPLVNAVFHGHTHDGDLDWLSQRVPILATGSAAVVADARPEEVANQYQVVLFERDAVQRWTRAYVPAEERWIGDTRGSRSGGDWKVRASVNFELVDSTFPNLSNTDPGISLEITREPSPEEAFLVQVARVCALRERPGAQIDRVRHVLGREYLQVSVDDGDIARMYPLTASTTAPDEETLRFVRRVHHRFAVNDSGVISHFVYGGEEAADKELVRLMRAERVHVMSFVEYQGLIDFRPYVAAQTMRLANDVIYPPPLYVQQGVRYSLGDVEATSDDALQTLKGWLTESSGRFVLVLGDFGTGKTFLLHELARSLATDTPGLTPVLVQLRDLEKGRTLDQLLAQHFAQHGLDDFSIRKFRYMLQEGRVVLLFDGFDELVVRVTYAKATEHFDTLLQAASGNAKVVITSRTQHFVSHEQVRTAIGDRVEAVMGRRIATLQAFDDRRIRQFLFQKFGDEAIADARFAMLGEIKDLIGLSQNPRMLSFIADLTEEQLSEARKSEADITPASLYRLLLLRWLTQEFDRVHPRGAPPGLSVDDRWRAVTELALRLWRTTDRGVTVSELTDSTASVLNFLTVSDLDPDTAAFQVGSGTLLVRDEGGNFSFIHQSVQEWLVASRIATEIADDGRSELLKERDLTALTVEFLLGLAPRDRLIALAAKTLTSAATDAAKRNAIAIERRTGVQRQTALEFAGQEARGTDFSNQDLAGANFRRANLGASRFVRSNLEHAEFGGANLAVADFSSANLRGARFEGANLTRAKLAGADLTGARFDGANLTRANTLGATLPADELHSASSTFGAALRIDQVVSPEYESASGYFSSIDVSDDEALLATASDRSISIWDLDTRQVLRQINERGVTALQFCHGCRQLVTSTRAGNVIWWDVETGRKCNELDAGQAALLCMAVGETGDLLVTGGEDGTVRVWRRTDAGWIRQHELHASAGFINSVALDATELAVAAASNDRMVHVWDLSTGTLRRSLEGHSTFVRSVVFGANATTVISGSGGEVLVWDVDSGENRRGAALADHADHLASDRTHRHVAILGSGLWIYDVKSTDTTQVADLSNGRRAVFRPDGLGLYVISEGAIHLLDMTRHTVDAVISARHRTEKRTRVAFSADGQTLVTTGLWDLKTGIQWWRDIVNDGDQLANVQGRIAIAAINDGFLRMRDLGTGREIFAIAAPNAQHLATGRRGLRMCMASSNGVRLVNIAAGKVVAMRPTDEPIIAIAISADERVLAAATAHRVFVIDAERAVGIASFDKSYSVTMQMAFTRDNTLVVGSDGAIQVFGRKGARFPAPIAISNDRGPLSFAVHPDLPVLLAGTSSGWISLWNLETGVRIGRHRLHRSAITSIAVTPDGGRAAVAGADGAVLHCALESDRLTTLATFLHLTEGWVTFTPDGSYKHGGSVNGAFWHVIGLCRFEVGDLLSVAPDLRIPDHLPLLNTDGEEEPYDDSSIR